MVVKMELTLWQSVALVHSFLFVVSAILIWRQKGLAATRKIAQTIFTLVLPVAGPIVAIAVLLTDILKPATPSDRYIGQSIDESRATILGWLPK